MLDHHHHLLQKVGRQRSPIAAVALNTIADATYKAFGFQMTFSFKFEIPSAVEYPPSVIIVAIVIIVVAFCFQNRRIERKLALATDAVEICTDIKTVIKRSATGLENSLPDVVVAKQATSAMRRNHSYRMEEEQSKKSSSEYTRRGQLWSKHASWNLPKAPRSHRALFRYPVQGLEHVIVSFNFS